MPHNRRPIMPIMQERKIPGVKPGLVPLNRPTEKLSKLQKIKKWYEKKKKRMEENKINSMPPGMRTCYLKLVEVRTKLIETKKALELSQQRHITEEIEWEKSIKKGDLTKDRREVLRNWRLGDIEVKKDRLSELKVDYILAKKDYSRSFRE